MGGKKDDDDASVRHTRLVSVAPVLFDTETRRRLLLVVVVVPSANGLMLVRTSDGLLMLWPPSGLAGHQ